MCCKRFGVKGMPFRASPIWCLCFRVKGLPSGQPLFRAFPPGFSVIEGAAIMTELIVANLRLLACRIWHVRRGRGGFIFSEVPVILPFALLPGRNLCRL